MSKQKPVMIDKVKTELGVPSLVINIKSADIEALTTPETKVSFLDALRSAINSFIEDGSNSESPLWIVQELPEDYGLPNNVDAKTASEKVRELLNECELTLKTEPEDFSDEWAGKVMYEETGEKFGTSNYWIFEITKSQFTDINYAVVDKAGVKPTINWGFS
jgi:hypothetical protein